MKLFVVWSQVDEELFYYLLVGGAIFFVSSIFVLIAQNKKMAIPGSELSVVDESIAAIGIGSAFFLLVSPLAWIHYYLLIVPLLLYLMKPSTQVKSTGRLFRIVSFTAIGCALLILSMEQIAVYLGNTEFKMTVTLNEFIAVKALSISLLIVVALIQHLSQTGYISLSRSEK